MKAESKKLKEEYAKTLRKARKKLGLKKTKSYEEYLKEAAKNSKEYKRILKDYKKGRIY